MVNKIKKNGLTKFTNAEHLGFHTGAQGFFNACTAEKISCATELPLYDAAILAQVDVVKRQLSSSITADLEKMDKERDELISFLFATFDAAKHSPIGAAKEAHKQLLPVMTPYRGMAYRTYVQESAEIIGMLKDLRAANLAAHITALNFTPVMDLLGTKNSEYIQLDKQRITEMPSKVETDTLRKNVDELYNQIVDKVNATVILTPNPAAETLVVGLNNYIDQINTSYNQRMGRSGNADTGAEPYASV